MRAWTSISFAILVGCTAVPAAPVPRQVSPEWGFSGEDTRVDLLGDGLLPSMDVSAGAPSGDDLDDAFEVFLQPVGDGSPDAATPLVGVVYQGLGHLSAVVPAGVAAGDYDVRVETPAGASGVGRGLFTVRDTRVDRIVLDVDAVTHEVYSEAAVSISLEDPSGVAVASELEVDVTVEGDGLSAADVTLRTEGFERVVALAAPAIGLRGTLGADGLATAFPLLRVPGEFTVRVAPTDAAARVGDDDVALDWSRGSELSVRVDLPSTPFVARAGEAFTATLTLVDQFGLPAPDSVVTVAVTDVCASWGTGLRVVGSATVSVRPTEATGTSRCATDRLVVVGAGVTGQSVDFQVDPGAHDGFSVLVSPSLQTAGEQVNAFVTPVDAWGNTTAWTGTIDHVDDGGGVDGFSCAPGDVVVCAVRVVKAGTARVLTVQDADGHGGASNPYSVVPAVAATLGVVPDNSAWVAGSPVALSFTLADAFGNAVSDASVDLSDVAVDDPRDEVACVLSGGRLRCSLYTATDGTTLDVDADVLLIPTGTVRLTGSSAPIAVVNAELASVQVLPDQTRVRAGVPLGVTVVALDAWANPYMVRANDLLSLTDTADALSPLSVTLGPLGEARTSVVFERAGRTALVAWQDDVAVGTSAPIDVEAADPVRLEVSVDTPWAFVGDADVVRVQALDVYGNRARHDETVAVRSEGGLAPDVYLPMFNGLAVGSVIWSSTATSDRLIVTSDEGGGLSGTSEEVLVARHCAPGPVVSAAISGLVCRDATGVAQVSASFVGATPAPGGTITTRGLREAGGEGVFGSAPVQVLSLTGDGEHTLRTLVVQSDGCGTEGTATVWAGPDDGSVVGELRVSVTPDILDLDAAPSATVRVDSATNCRGTPADGAPVRLRTDRGALLGLTPTGAGLRLTLDAAGDGVTTLDMASASTGGLGQLTAWSDAAYGEAPFEVLGDHQLPEIWSQDPKGAVTLATSKLVIGFSEAIEPGTVNDDSVLVQGTVEVGVSAYTFSDAGRTLTLSLNTTIGPSSNGWVLLLGDTITDLYGNSIAGAWDGQPRIYEGPFGVEDATAPISACGVDRTAFAPDGDDGPGAHADEVAFDFSSASSPAWWVVSVEAEDGTLLRRHYLPPTARFGAWSWDGRDVDGRIVADGPYTLSVRPEGARGGPGGACARDVDVAHERGAP